MFGDELVILLINPPVTKPGESPAGLAQLGGVLRRFHVPFTLLDANLEGLLYLLGHPAGTSAEDTWTRRAYRHLHRHLDGLRSWPLYQKVDRYKRAVHDVNRVLGAAASSADVALTLTNYQDHRYAPVNSQDLLEAAAHPEVNPFFPYFQHRLAGVLERSEPSVVGISLNYLSQAVCAFALIGFITQRWPTTKIVLGGGLVTSWMKQPRWRKPFTGLVDEMIAGPGEYPLLALMGIDAVEPVHGLPDYTGLPLADYFAPGPILPYTASRGCYWNKCSFCPERAERNPYLPIPPDQAVRDLHSLVATRTPVLVHVLDNAISPALLKKLVDQPLGTPWYGFARITPQLTDPDFCQSLKRSGCAMIKLGLESGDQGVLDSLNKGVNLGEASHALRELANAGIASYVYLLFGTPAETETAARKTLDFVAGHSSCISYLNAALFNLPMYGPEAETVETKKFSEGDLSLYADFIHPQGWNRPVVREFLDKEFKRHPAIATILRRQPPFFTSNHAPLFALAKSWNR